MADQEDRRRAIYQDLHQGQISQQEEANRTSAELVLGELWRYLQPKSVLDVGCGLGTWLQVAHRLGSEEILGIEGSWLDRSLAKIPADKIRDLDLERGFDLGRRFDLVMSLEVGEHLFPEAASAFVASLVQHGDVVLFSAAIPFQGGHHHVNEQFLDYWADLFAKHDYQPIDFLRRRFWKDPAILWWLRQNLIVFAKRELTIADGAFAKLAESQGPLSIVHPDIYRDRVIMSQKILDEHQRLIELLSSGETFSVQRQPNGQLTIHRLS